MDAAGGFVLGEVCALLPMEFCVGILALVGARVSYRWKKKKGQKPVLVDSASFCYSWNGTNG